MLSLIAFCGFFVAGSNAELSNDASKVVLMRVGERTALTMSNNYKGPPESFAMVVPVPVVLQKEQVKTLPPDVFDHVDRLSAPRLVEYWEEDPCAPPRPDVDELSRADFADAKAVKHKGHVTVEARFTVGEYDVVILSADQATGLETWLRDNHYSIPKGAADALAPYVKSKMKFFVAKVDIKKVKRDKNGTVVLSPLRFHYESPELRLPVRLGLLNAKGKQDLIVYILHPDKRFEAANYPNVFAPTNLEVLDEVRASFASFYAELFDEVMRRANGRAVVTEYAWDSASCDPCSAPPLEQKDLAVLGADVLGGDASDRRRPSWVLTRLHTRYAKETLSEDLLFRQAKPVVGGRAGFDTRVLEPPGEVQEDRFNNFQARYIIRHYWKKPVSCPSPRWERWGGPPDMEHGLVAAQDLASAARGKVVLQKVVRTSLMKYDIPGLGPARPRR